MYDFLMYERGGEVLLDPIGTLVALTIVFFVGVVVANLRLPGSVKKLIYAALAFRVIGATARYIVLFGVYNGSGDARDYYSGGLYYASEMWKGNFAPLFDPLNWWRNIWWGTQFVYFPSSFVHAIIGPSMPGGFLIFSLFAFLGLSGFVIAFRRTYPHVPLNNYARWVYFFPALWFWPSSIGKEAIVLCGLGLAMWGYVGKEGRINWLLLAGGLFLVFGIRPEVAAVVIASILIAHWLSLLTGKWTLLNTVQAIVLIAGGIFGLYTSFSFIGVQEVSVENVQTYMMNEGGRQLGGGSAIDAPPVGLAGIPFALMNILLRPFPWEAGGLLPMISSFEIMAFWVMLFYRRRSFGLAMKHWRHDPLLRVAIPFVLMYSISLGMVLANMGIVARQRIFIFPFLFLLLEAVPKRALKRKPRPAGFQFDNRRPPPAGPRSPEPGIAPEPAPVPGAG